MTFESPHADEYLLRSLRAADALLKDITYAVESSKLFQPPLAFRGRVKREASALEKIARKRRTEPSYSSRNLTDLVGIRFVTLLRQDIAKVVENLFRLITGNGAAIQRGVFASCRLTEFKQYVSVSPVLLDYDGGTGGKDRLREKLRELFEVYFPSSGVVEFLHEVRAQYSSVHIVLTFTVDGGGGELEVPVEIQLRSVFEDAWGEIDHMLFYEADRIAEPTGRQDRLAASRHLAVLKQMLDTAAVYASLIAEGGHGGAEDQRSSIKKSLDGVEYIREVTADIRGYKDLFGEFIELVRVKDQLDLEAKRGSPRPGAYASLAEQFQDLLSRLQYAAKDSNLKGHDADRLTTAIYLLSMEEALSRLLSGTAAQVELAVTNYRLITAEYKDRPTGWFRLGQACQALVEFEDDLDKIELLGREADQAYARARTVLDETPIEKDLVISPGQREYLEPNIERLRGFAIWRTSDKRRSALGVSSEKDFQEVKMAWDITARRLGPFTGTVSQTKMSLLNNATFFALEAVELAKSTRISRKLAPNLQEVRELVETLKRGCQAYSPATINVWHTVLRGYNVLGDRDSSVNAAWEVLRAHRRANLRVASTYDREIHERAFGEAMEVLDRRGAPREPSPAAGRSS